MLKNDTCTITLIVSQLTTAKTYMNYVTVRFWVTAARLAEFCVQILKTKIVQ